MIRPGRTRTGQRLQGAVASGHVSNTCRCGGTQMGIRRSTHATTHPTYLTPSSPQFTERTWIRAPCYSLPTLPGVARPDDGGDGVQVGVTTTTYRPCTLLLLLLLLLSRSRAAGCGSVRVRGPGSRRGRAAGSRRARVAVAVLHQPSLVVRGATEGDEVSQILWGARVCGGR